MKQSWFAGNFCPIGAKCSHSNNELMPTTGPEIRSMLKEEGTEIPFLAEIQQFDVSPPEGEIEWMKADGQQIGLEEYITLYPIIGYMYGETSSRELFPLPNLNNHPNNNYYICVKGGEEPVRPNR